ncbi:glycoside hydrolase family 3 N-terminal domain-containing protein [Agrococcus sp. Marseille-P2731]|uniref:glycoside hydrolase family 3 N-terminal domain-containing protein n=1 Tax=Agrococcus sp. Marseille-P2731 TaxID=1841862 RepID=UPI000931B4E2|nr:glycoside hydrolase family 3 N-terminal domain-containing protein [Agrococcus sp. Marseille-P2731]
MSLLADARATLMPGFVGTELPAWMAGLLAEGLVSCCLYGENVVDPQQLRRLSDAVRAVRADAIVALDEEGGDVTRVHYATGSPFPGAAVLGRADDLDWTRSIAARVGEHVRAVGATMTFGPVADVNVDPDNPVIGVRSFGADAQLAARHAAAWVEGAQGVGVAATAKHFPGHGDTAVDSHVGLPVVHADVALLRARELEPFRAVIAAGAAAIMTSHILVPAIDAVPATHSRAILTELLRGELGYEGLIVSDALDMAGASAEIGIPEAAVRALTAGCDLLCLGTATGAEGIAAIERAVLAAVEEGRLDAERVRDAARRTRARAAAAPPPLPLSALGDATADDLARIRSTFSVTEEALRWIAQHRGEAAVVRLERAANIAAGAVPWDPFEGSVVVEPGAVPQLQAGPVIVLGKDLERGPESAASIAALRERHDLLVVDAGWSAGRLADVATFGASRACGLALREMLAR